MMHSGRLVDLLSLARNPITHLMLFGLLAMSAARAGTFQLTIIALNDFHGNLESPGKFRANAQSPEVPAGGADFLAGYVAYLRARNKYTVVVSAGDLTGASPLISALFHDEGTIEVMNQLGLDINAVGNHEFDKGKQELLRLQRGGCSTLDANTCAGAMAGTPSAFAGAKFQYLAANVFDTATGKTLFPAYTVKTYHGVKVAFIGLTLENTPSVVTAAGVAGLRFADEAGTIDTAVRELKRRGVESFVVLIHQGGAQSGKTVDIDECAGGLDGTPIKTIVTTLASRLDDAVRVVISAHTHAAYICRIPTRSGNPVLVTSASSFARVLTEIDATIDTKTGKMTAVTAVNRVVDRTNIAIEPDSAVQRIVDRYAALTAPLVNRVVGSVTAEITRTPNDAGESAMGDLIADAELEATSAVTAGAAQIAFMNDGGIRAGLAGGQVTFGELYTAQPFGNSLVTMTLTGAQIKTALEEQFKGCVLGAPAAKDARASDASLQVSQGFSYAWSPAGAACSKVDAASIKLRGVTVIPTASYRITANSFLADGGDQISIFKSGTDRVTSLPDVDALIAYFAKHGSVEPIQLPRIRVLP
jgi:5'-nucleotidase